MFKLIGGLLMGLMVTSAVAGDIKLPQPEKTNTTTFIQALENRHSDREFSSNPVDDKTLSTVLWVAYGVNKTDEKNIKLKKLMENYKSISLK